MKPLLFMALFAVFIACTPSSPRPETHTVCSVPEDTFFQVILDVTEYRARQKAQLLDTPWADLPLEAGILAIYKNHDVSDQQMKDALACYGFRQSMADSIDQFMLHTFPKETSDNYQAP